MQLAGPYLLPLFVFIGFSYAIGNQWDYLSGSTGPKQWSVVNKAMCAGMQQSPISLDYDTEYNKNLQTLVISKLGSNTAPFTVTNTGYGVKMNVPDGEWGVNIIDGEDKFIVAQLHFHWGADSSKGSEHTIGKKAYPLEGHLVTYRKSMYSTFAEAASMPNGLAVLGFFFDESEETEFAWSAMPNLATAMTSLVTPKSVRNISYFDIGLSFTKANLDKYYRYAGSLTTPPCTENVIWTVMATPLTVKKSELAAFRNLQYSSSFGGGKLVDNYRPVLPLNPTNAPYKRVLQTSFNSAHSAQLSFVGKLVSSGLIISSILFAQKMH